MLVPTSQSCGHSENSMEHRVHIGWRWWGCWWCHVVNIHICEGSSKTFPQGAAPCVTGPSFLWDTPLLLLPCYRLLQHTSIPACPALGSYNLLFPWLEHSFFKYVRELLPHFVLQCYLLREAFFECSHELFLSFFMSRPYFIFLYPAYPA